MKFLKDLALAEKRVLMRSDLDLSLSEKTQAADLKRLLDCLATLLKVVEMGGLPIILAHLGKPDGKYEPALSLRPLAAKLNELLKARAAPLQVLFAESCTGEVVRQMSRQLEPGTALLLENVRFNPGEETNDPEFCAQLAALGDVYLNDAFACAHRLSASTVGVAKRFTTRAAGPLLQRELEIHQKATENPKKPMCVVLGGARFSAKYGILKNLAQRADKLIIGGAMANTFLAAQGLQLGRSLVERELLPRALEILVSCARRDCKVYLPVDFVAAPSHSAQGLARAVPVQEVPADLMALDIGPASSLLFREALQSAETIIWNGPMGASEKEEYSKGTTELIESLASSHALTLAGGRDTAAAIQEMQLGHKFSHISAGRGAFLSLLEGNALPGLLALE